MLGEIKYVNVDRGYGFIAPSTGGDDLFFHVSNTDPDLAFDEKLKFRRVNYTIDHGGKKGPRATDVRAAD